MNKANYQKKLSIELLGEIYRILLCISRSFLLYVPLQNPGAAFTRKRSYTSMGLGSNLAL